MNQRHCQPHRCNGLKGLLREESCVKWKQEEKENWTMNHIFHAIVSCTFIIITTILFKMGGEWLFECDGWHFVIENSICQVPLPSILLSGTLLQSQFGEREKMGVEEVS